MSKKFCINCGNLLNPGATKYCSIACQKDYEYKQRVNQWKEGLLPGYSGTKISPFLRKYMLEKVGYKCEICNWGIKNPFNGNLPLEIHHIDGDYTNCKEENLQVLCPNCHSLTDNYKGMNRDSKREGRDKYLNRKKPTGFCIDCGKEVFYGSIRCKDCETKRRTIPFDKMEVTREELKNLIRTKPFTQIAKDYDVSDNAIRKWCDKFNLPRTKKEINSYSDSEWENI